MKVTQTQEPQKQEPRDDLKRFADAMRGLETLITFQAQAAVSAGKWLVEIDSTRIKDRCEKLSDMVKQLGVNLDVLRQMIDSAHRAESILRTAEIELQELEETLIEAQWPELIGDAREVAKWQK